MFSVVLLMLLLLLSLFGYCRFFFGFCGCFVFVVILFLWLLFLLLLLFVLLLLLLLCSGCGCCFVLLLFAPEHPKIKKKLKLQKSLFFQCFSPFPSFPLLLFAFFLSVFSASFFLCHSIGSRRKKREK